MSIVYCKICGTSWDGTCSPICPQCQAKEWEQCLSLIAPKHDPNVLPSASTSYRSVLTEDFVAHKHDFLEYAAYSGEWYFSKQYGKYCHFTPRPLGQIPGSGIHSGNPMPDHALDGLLIANALQSQSAHAYAVDQSRFRAEIHQGKHVPLPRCTVAGCDNIAIPGHSLCQEHRSLSATSDL